MTKIEHKIEHERDPIWTQDYINYLYFYHHMGCSQIIFQEKTLILTRNFWSILHGYDYIFYNKLWCSIVEFF